ncbi:MAG: CHC2 zinc finger domain-containing protein, partial [Chloroflexi bacterium]|nr:CHC2 zinc finger domain-containing protein [Chloroflexota bacterium]
MSVISDVKDRLDIVEVIGNYLQLHKTGRSFKALCPFHPEKTPSFIVSPERQSWHCFGCGTGGDLFSFVMKKEAMNFEDALKFLAEKAGVVLVQKQEYRNVAENKSLFETNEAAAQYYHHLLVDTPAGHAA